MARFDERVVIVTGVNTASVAGLIDLRDRAACDASNGAGDPALVTDGGLTAA